MNFRYLLIIVCLWQFSSYGQTLENKLTRSAVGEDASLSSTDDDLDDLDRSMDNTINRSASGLLSNSVIDEKKHTTLSDLKLGFVNFRRIMATTPQLQVIRSDLDNEFRAQQQALTQAQAELNALEKRVIDENQNEALENFEKQLIAKRREVARQDVALRDNYGVRRNEEIAKLQRLVLEQIIAVAKERGFDVILNDVGVIYVSEQADLTPIVIERMKTLYTKPNDAKPSDTKSSDTQP